MAFYNMTCNMVKSDMSTLESVSDLIVLELQSIRNYLEYSNCLSDSESNIRDGKRDTAEGLNEFLVSIMQSTKQIDVG